MDYTKGEWRHLYHAPGNTLQHGLAGYSIQTGKAAVAFNISKSADAFLIAAAPDMYEALKVLVDRIDQGLALGEALDIYPARQALAKAEGK